MPASAFKAFGSLFIILLTACLCDAWKPDRVHFIDRSRTQPNYLFRGSEPVVNGEFIIDELKDTIKKAAQRDVNITLPDDFYLVDFNLLSIEFNDWMTEQEYFKKHPEKGVFIHYPIIGDLLGPDTYPKSVRDYLASTLTSWQVDNLPKVMDKLSTLLNQAFGRPTVIYVHCEAGMDRTGEVSGSYYIRHRGWSFQRAIAYNNQCIQNRHMNSFSQNAFQWYCYYLRNVEKIALDCNIPESYGPNNCTVV